MQSVRAFLLAVACSSLARVQSLTPREKYVQRMTDCLEATKRPASCNEYQDRISQVNSTYSLQILNPSQSSLSECYVFANNRVVLRVARDTCEDTGGLLPWFLNSEKPMLQDMFIARANMTEMWVGLKNNWVGGRREGWKGMCPAKTGGLKPIDPQKDIVDLFTVIDDTEPKNLGARYSTMHGLKDRVEDDDKYVFVCMTVIRPPQTSSPPPPTTSPSMTAVTPQPTPAPSRRPSAPVLTSSKGPPARAPTASKAASLATGLIIGLILLFLCLIGLSAFMFLIMKKKRQKLEQAQRDAEQQDKTKEKDELSAGATQSQSCYTEGTTATETATPDMTPVMMPVHLGDTKEQCSGKKSCLCTMCRAKKELLGEKIPEKEEEKGVVSLVSDML